MVLGTRSFGGFSEFCVILIEMEINIGEVFDEGGLDFVARAGDESGNNPRNDKGREKNQGDNQGRAERGDELVDVDGVNDVIVSNNDNRRQSNHRGEGPFEKIGFGAGGETSLEKV